MVKKSKLAPRFASPRPGTTSLKLRRALFSLQRSLCEAGGVEAVFEALRGADPSVATRLLAICNNDPKIAGLALSTKSDGSEFTVLDAMLVGDATRALADTERLIAMILKETSRFAHLAPQDGSGG